MNICCTERSESLARLSISSAAAEVTGLIRGPYCKYSRTLPSNFSIARGEACIVDPCYWCPALPFRYQVSLEINFENGEKDQLEFLWGLRWCVPHKHDLRLHGKRYVVRAVQARHEDLDLTELRGGAAALVTAADNVNLLDQASEIGVMVIVAGGLTTDESYRGLNLFPAVHFVKDFPAGATPRDVLGIASDPNQMPRAALHWIEASEIPRYATYAKPIFAAQASDSDDVADMRRACDRLQRDLAKYGQYAGYVIHSGE